MSLGDRLVDELKKASQPGSVSAEQDGVRATADVAGSGQYGADVRGISVERTEPRDPDGRGERMGRAVERIAGRVKYLSEDLEPLEADPASGRGVLRTRRADVKGREYWEVEVDGGDRVDVGRYRGSDDGGRERLAENFGHGATKRLVDDLAGAMGDEE